MKKLGLLLASLGMVGVLAACAGSVEGSPGLEEILETGESPDWYWSQLEEAGYEIASVNYDREDYVEYEIVDAEETYEVQITLDPETNRATDVEITSNPWKASETEAILERNTNTVAVPSGTRLVVSLNDYLDSGENAQGDEFTMTVKQDVVVGSSVAIPEGAVVRGYVASVESAGRPQKGGRLVLKPQALSVRGEETPLEGVITAEGRRLEKGEGSFKDDLKEIAIGAGLGGLIGGIIEGGEGALAGVLIGGGGVFLATKGEQIELPPDTELIVELREDVRVPTR